MTETQNPSNSATYPETTDEPKQKRSVKFGDMRGEFDTLQLPLPGNPKGFMRKL